MPAAGGPNTLGESNLVFAYDTGDVSNSYRGEPTVNVFPDPKILLGTSGWAISNATGGTTSVDVGRNGGQSLKITVASGGDQYQYKHYGYGSNKGGTVFTYSAYIKTSGITGTGVGMSTYWFDINGSFIWSELNASPRITGTQDWTRVTVTSTAPSGTYYVVAIFYPVDKNGVGAYWITDIQIEEKSHATPFVAGTRSATQGLLPLIGNNTLDLSNVSFDSNAQMVFDGTDDYVSIPTYTFGNGNWTLNMLVNANDFANFNLMSNTSGGPVTNAFGAYSGKIFYCNYDGSWQSHSGNTTLSTGTWYMLTWVNYAGAATNLGTMQMFVNGIADSSVFNSYTTNGGPCNAIGANWYSRFNGKINVVQIYNKSLTAQEIKQNYQQYKTRFNLS